MRRVSVKDGVVIGCSLQEVANVTGVSGIEVGVDLPVREVDSDLCSCRGASP